MRNCTDIYNPIEAKSLDDYEDGPMVQCMRELEDVLKKYDAAGMLCIADGKGGGLFTAHIQEPSWSLIDIEKPHIFQVKNPEAGSEHHLGHTVNMLNCMLEVMKMSTQNLMVITGHVNEALRVSRFGPGKWSN